MVAAYLCPGHDPRVVFGEPVTEVAHRQLQLVSRRRGIGQPPGREPLLGHRLHSWRQCQWRPPVRHPLARLGVDLAAMKEHHLQLMEVCDPHFRGIVAVALRRGIEKPEVIAFAEDADGLQGFVDVPLGDALGVQHSGAQRDAADRPGHRLHGRSAVKAQRHGLFDETSDTHVDPHRGGEVDHPQLTGGQGERIVERGVPP